MSEESIKIMTKSLGGSLGFTLSIECFENVNNHIVWSVKYRRKVLNSTIEKRLKKILLDVAKE